MTHRHRIIRSAAVSILFFLVTEMSGLAGGGVGPQQQSAADSCSIRICGGYGSTLDYYNVDGVRKFFDTAGTHFSQMVIGLTGNYGLSNSLELNLDVPLTISSVTSDSKFPQRSITAPDYIGIGASYRLAGGEQDRMFASLSTMLKIPWGFHNGIYDDPAHPTFLSDGFFQLTTSLNIGFRFKDVWFKGNVGYNWRDEEPADEIPYLIELGISRVPGTGIFLGCNGVISTADPTVPSRPFYTGASGSAEEQERIDGGRGIFHTIDRETHLSIHAGAFVHLFGPVTLDGNIMIRLFGTNALNLPRTELGASYVF